jgi:hypothetical protein
MSTEGGKWHPLRSWLWRASALAGLAVTVIVVSSTAGAAAVRSRPAQAISRSTGIFINARGDRCRRVSASATTAACIHITTTGGESLRSGARPPRSGSRSRPAQGLTPPRRCHFGNLRTYKPAPSRDISCVDRRRVAIAYIIKNGTIEIKGRLHYEEQSWVRYTGSTWTHGLIIIVGKGTDVLQNGISAVIQSTCDASFEHPCNATSNGGPDDQPVTLTPETTFTRSWDENDTGPAVTQPGSADGLDGFIGTAFFFTPPPPYPSTIDSDLGLLTGRCDSIISSTDTCVNQARIPTLSLSLSTYGAAAAIIEWAQSNLSAAWGLQGVGQPLTRLANMATRNANRAIICDSTFTNMGSTIGGDDGSKDSCDEFPFAASYQSGALNGVTSGSQCAQVTATEIANPTGDLATDWNSVQPDGTITGNEACVRGHIPLALNKAVGGKYGGFIKSKRLLDRDQFWVAVIP